MISALQRASAACAPAASSGWPRGFNPPLSAGNQNQHIPVRSQCCLSNLTFLLYLLANCGPNNILPSNLWVPGSGGTIHSSPFGLKSFAIPDMASQIDTRSCVNLFSYQTKQQLIASCCKAMSGFAKLLSPEGKMRIVSLLLEALQLISNFH